MSKCAIRRHFFVFLANNLLYNWKIYYGKQEVEIIMWYIFSRLLIVMHLISLSNEIRSTKIWFSESINDALAKLILLGWLQDFSWTQVAICSFTRCDVNVSIQISCGMTQIFSKFRLLKRKQFSHQGFYDMVLLHRY